MNVLVNCEESATVREAFARRGHNAWSCDLLPSRLPGKHMQCDAREAIKQEKWDLMIAHPPCTFLSNSGAKHLYIDGRKSNGRDESRWNEMTKATEFFRELLDAPVPLICCENPIMLGYAVEIIGCKHDQIIQPWQFGHGETKATCLWLKGLPKLQPTNIVEGREQRIWKMSPGPQRARERSVTCRGIAEAMADQWGIL
jgi:hypothetical protein